MDSIFTVFESFTLKTFSTASFREAVEEMGYKYLISTDSKIEADGVVLITQYVIIYKRIGAIQRGDVTGFSRLAVNQVNGDNSEVYLSGYTEEYEKYLHELL